MFAYLKNIAAREGVFKNASGLILYPTVGEDLRFGFEIQGHTIFIRTVNLAGDWRSIEGQLISLMLQIGQGTWPLEKKYESSTKTG